MADTKFVACFVVNDPDTGEEVELEIHKDLESGALFAAESDWLDKNGVCNSPYNPIEILTEEYKGNPIVYHLKEKDNG